MIAQHLKRLFDKQRDWDYCIIYSQKRPPAFIEAEVHCHLTEDGNTMHMQVDLPHPAPRHESESKQMFTVDSYVAISEVFAVDYFVRKRIAQGPGVMSMVKGVS